MRFDHRWEQQRRIVEAEFRDYGWRVPQLLEHLASADDFYFDAINQIVLDSWQRGRIALVGTRDSVPDRQSAVGRAWQRSRRTYWRANCVGPGRPAGRARAYEQKISRYVELSRAAAVKTMRSVIPASRTAVRLVPWATATLVKLPTSIQKLAWSQNGLGKALAALQLPNYEELATNR